MADVAQDVLMPTGPEAKRWAGRLFRGRTATAESVEICLHNNGLRIYRGTDKPLFWAYGSVAVTQGHLTGQRVRVEQVSGNEAVVVGEAGFLAALDEKMCEFEPRPLRLVRRIRRMNTGVLVAVLAMFLVGLFAWGIPQLASIVSSALPVDFERRIGLAAVNRLVPAGRRCNDPDVNYAIGVITKRLLAAAPPHPYQFEVMVVDSPRVNAFAAPGGYVVVYRGLLARTRRPEELAGVIAHEMQHVLRRHATTAIVERGALSLILAMYVGSESAATQLGAEIAGELGSLKYSRDAEYEADSEGMWLMARAGIDPAGVVEAFAMLRESAPDEEEEVSEYDATHPRLDKRIKRLTDELGRVGAGAATLLPDLDWDLVRAKCKGGEGTRNRPSD